MITGDGALGLNGFDFDTLVRFDIPAVLVVGNDAAWGEIRIPQVGLYGPQGEVATRLAPSRYDWLCEIFGGHAEHVERPEDLRPALERALEAGKPAIVNVMLDPKRWQGTPTAACSPRARPYEPDRHTNPDASREHEHLTRRDRHSHEVVSLLDLPDTRPRVTRVAGRCDLPEGVARAPCSGAPDRCVGGAREDRPQEDAENSQNHDASDMCSPL